MCMVTNCSSNKTTTSPLIVRRRSLSPGWKCRFQSDSKPELSSSSSSALTCTESISLDGCSSSFKSILKVKTQAESEASSPCVRKQHSKNSKKVDFQNATVHVHIHAVTLGDNPSVSNGPPVSLDWRKIESTTYTLEDFFLSKDETRRSKNDLILPKSSRREWLLSNGFAQEEIRQVERQMKSIRKSRKMNSATSSTPHHQRLKMIHTIARLLQKTSHKKKSNT